LRAWLEPVHRPFSFVLAIIAAALAIASAFAAPFPGTDYRLVSPKMPPRKTCLRCRRGPADPAANRLRHEWRNLHRPRIIS
jgi:hypothetical protein